MKATRPYQCGAQILYNLDFVPYQKGVITREHVSTMEDKTTLHWAHEEGESSPIALHKQCESSGEDPHQPTWPTGTHLIMLTITTSSALPCMHGMYMYNYIEYGYDGIVVSAISQIFTGDL